MKETFLLIFLFFSIILSAQSNTIITDEDSGKQMLIGLVDRSVFSDSAFADWFVREYEDYEINDSTLMKAENLIHECHITIVLGTWCPDSRREVPRFFKILDELKFPGEQINIIAVDRDKEDPEEYSANLSVEFVPTFIITKSGEELGRIIEFPDETLEADLISILKRKG